MDSIKNSDEFRLKILEEINLLRKEPQNYADKIRKYLPLFKGKILKIPESIPILYSEGPKAFEEAAFFLDNCNSVNNLKYCPGLTHAAHDALLDIQKKEEVDSLCELDVENFIKKHGQVIGYFGQAVDFGSYFPELVVVNLVVDDGDQLRSNRANIMNPNFKLVGISTGPHAVYHKCTVLFYSRHFYQIDEDPGELSEDNYESPSDKNKANESHKTRFVRYSSLLDSKEKSNNDEDFDLPQGVVKLEKQEKIVTEGGVKKKIIKLIKHLDNGDTETEIFKEKISEI